MNEKVEALEAQCAATVQEKKRLADEADTTANRLVRAEKLTSGLASEGVRWLESLDSLGEQKVQRFAVFNPTFSYRTRSTCLSVPRGGKPKPPRHTSTPRSTRVPSPTRGDR